MSDEIPGALGRTPPLPAANAPVEGKEMPKQASPSLPLMNTLMAADRTLMSWTRTSLSLLSFGFTIFKVLQALQETEGRFATRPEIPRNAGLFLTAMGTLAMVMGTIEYWQTLRVLEQQRIFSRPRSPLIMAIIMSISGILLFVSILAKLL